MDSIFTKLSRELIMTLRFFLPKERHIRLERWLGGREEARRLARADLAVVSFGNKGDPNSYEVRRAKVGGYRNYLVKPRPRRSMNSSQRNSPGHGYDSSPEPDRVDQSVNG